MTITRVWLEDAGEKTFGYACAAGLSALPAVVGHHTTWLEWLTSVGIGALTAFLTIGASLRIDNGTTSLNPRVVADPNPAKKADA